MQTQDVHERFMISQVGVWIKDGKCLILEDAVKPGTWLIPGGRIEINEESDKAFARELKEEIHLESFQIVKLLDVRICSRNNVHNPYCAIVYLIESNQEQVAISQEHSQFRWISENELSNCHFTWPFAEQILRNGFQFTKS